MPSSNTPAKLWPWIVLILTPLFFASNLIFGRTAADEVAPFTLAFVRWLSVALLLTPFMVRAKTSIIVVLQKKTRLWLTLGFLGMWICGAIVYLALGYTTAVNAALVYSTSPIFVILIQYFLYARAIKMREGIGIVIAFIGVCYILLKGDLDLLLALEFNYGDILILMCSVAWAFYAILQKDDDCQKVPTFAFLGFTAAAGALLLFPFAAYEFLIGAKMPTSSTAWASITGIVFSASLIAFSGVQYSIKHLGPTINVLSLYLLPIYGTGLGVLLLGEPYKLHHFVGTILVLGGVILASAPKKIRK